MNLPIRLFRCRLLQSVNSDRNQAQWRCIQGSMFQRAGDTKFSLPATEKCRVANNVRLRRMLP